jgi:DNA-binding FadR family transcriptional regulator
MGGNSLTIQTTGRRGPTGRAICGFARKRLPFTRVATRPKLARHVQAAESLGRRILGGELRPGTVLPNATQMARLMSVSRPALREALKLLAGKGLVESSPRRGTVVRPRVAWNRLDEDVLLWQMGEQPNAGFMRDLYELRRMIEPEAAAFAAKRATKARLADVERAFDLMAGAEPSSPVSVEADVDFHISVLIASGNEFLASFGPAIRASLTMAIRFQRVSCHTRDHFVPDHGAIAVAIKRRDPEGARAAALKLLAQAESDFRDALRLRGHAA